MLMMLNVAAPGLAALKIVDLLMVALEITATAIATRRRQ
jgi:hypothetical protein